MARSRKDDGERPDRAGPVAFQIEGKAATRAVVVHAELRGSAAGQGRGAEARLAEAVGLARAIDLDIAASLAVGLAGLTPATFFGRGKVDELGRLVEESEAELVIVNGQLSPGQQRNLERAWKAKVLDRTGLILEIFGRRASTREGRLQVELAHLEYQKSRLVRSWTHLERQRGGFGFLGGPGESQLEADRRLIQERIARIKVQLDQVKRTRALHRKSRSKVPYPVVALVGYTNAGKSTLFNRLTEAEVLAKDLLFATLDPTMRQIELPRGRRIILSDTVGFISDLPTMLVAAFRATLEEVLEADVILHVRDISHPESEAQAADVATVLKELGVDETARSRIVEVWNKADLLDPATREQLAAAAERRPGTVLASAVTGEGIAALLDLVERQVAETFDVYRLTLAPADGEGIAWAYGHGEVLDRGEGEEAAVILTVRFAPAALALAARRYGAALVRLDKRDPSGLAA